MRSKTKESEQKSSENEVEDEKNEPTDEQMYSAISFWVVLVLIGIPLWWKTTEVYRVSLPYSEIDALHELNTKIYMTIHVVTIEESHGAALVQDLANIFRVSKLFQINFKQHSLDKAILGSTKSLEEIDKKIKHPHFEGSLQLFELPGLRRFTPKSIILGQNRTIYFSSDTGSFELYTFLTTSILNEEIMPNTMSHMKSPVKNEVNEFYSMLQVLSPTKAGLSKYLRRKIPQSDDFDILFTILNPEPEVLDVKFNIPQAIDEYITPFLDELKDMNGFHVKSQWLYFINLQVQPKFLNNSDKGAHYGLSENLLPHLITPLEKKLASHVSRHPCLNFVLYVSPCSQSPLYIYTKKGFQVNGANAFISPKWGGIQIYNPDRQSCSNDDKAIVEPDKHQIMSVFLQQLRLLLGIPGLEELEEEFILDVPVNLRLWEKDFLLRVRTIEQLTSAKLTLRSLSKLLGKISNIVINDKVGEAIMSALQNIHKATDFLNTGKLGEAYRFSKMAFLSSETAFTDPSLLALLYFPDDQKYAVYIPLFLPIIIPVLISFRQIKEWALKKFRKTVKSKTE